MYVELLVGNESGTKVYQPVVQEGIEWSTERKNTPGKLVFKVLYDNILDFSEGSPVRMKVDGDNVFFGFVFKQQRTKDKIITVTAYDQLRYLKNKDTKVYEGKTANQFVKMIADDYALNLGTLDDTGYVIESRVEENTSLFEMIANALDLTLTNTGEMYVLYDDFGKLTLKSLSFMYVGVPGAYLMIDEETGQNFDYTSSIDENTYNKIKLTYDNKDTGKRDVYITQDSSNINKWGILQYFDTLQKKLRLAVDTVPEEMIYCLKIDCKKFYPSIDHETLKQKFRRKYKDPELIELIDEVIDSISTCPATDENIEFYRSCGNEIKIVKINGKDFIEGVGIPIGNYFSQYDGNFFLSGFDHWIKEVKRVKHYYRYMDDICIFARTKEELHQLLAEINEYFIQNLKLRIKGNYQIFPSFIRGIDFVGYRIFLNSTLLRKSTCQEMKRKMTNIRKKVENGQKMNYSEWCSINSYKGWLKHCDSSHLSDKYIVPIQQYADDYYTNHIKAKKKKKGGKKHERVRKSTQYKAA